MVILDKLFFLVGILFVSIMVTTIIVVALNYFDASLNIGDKEKYNKGIWIVIIILSLLIAYSCYRDTKRNNLLYNYITSTDSIEELREILDTEEFFNEK